MGRELLGLMRAHFSGESGSAPAVEVDEAMHDALRSLGYVQ